MTIKIKEKIVRRFNRKTHDYDRICSIFDKYQVSDIQESDHKWKTIQVFGPKQSFVLCECQKPLKVYRPNEPVKELTLFYVMAQSSRFGFPGVTKIQGATHFALDGDMLIPYRSSGRGLVEEL